MNASVPAVKPGLSVASSQAEPCQARQCPAGQPPGGPLSGSTALRPLRLPLTRTRGPGSSSRPPPVTGVGTDFRARRQPGGAPAAASPGGHRLRLRLAAGARARAGPRLAAAWRPPQRLRFQSLWTHAESFFPCGHIEDRLEPPAAGRSDSDSPAAAAAGPGS